MKPDKCRPQIAIKERWPVVKVWELGAAWLAANRRVFSLELTAYDPNGPEDHISNSKRRLWSVVVAFALSIAALVACGRADVGSGASTSTPPASGARTSPQASPSSSPTSDETAGWLTYTSPVSGYTLKYPPSWFDLGGQDDQQGHDFSSENVGSPYAMSDTGIHFYVLATNAAAADCPKTNVSGPGTLISQTSVTVGGYPGNRYIFNEDFFDVIVNVSHGRCFDLWFGTKTDAARTGNAHVIDLIISHFSLPA